MRTEQIQTWIGEFGREYTERNTFESEELFNRSYIDKFGVSRDDINREFLKDTDRGLRILEVGCNRGNQLAALERIGFVHLYGIEIQHHAVCYARKRLPLATLIQASAFSLPFQNETFDMVFTSNVLIHIAPKDISKVLGEIYRCTRKYIWGFEYYASAYTEVLYRGRDNLLWKADFVRLFLEQFPDLVPIGEQRFAYRTEPGNIDTMYLFEKRLQTHAECGGTSR